MDDILRMTHSLPPWPHRQLPRDWPEHFRLKRGSKISAFAKWIAGRRPGRAIVIAIHTMAKRLVRL
ncbi:MAG: hypothetical protein WB392_01805 [Methanotrichaceae archaeon]